MRESGRDDRPASSRGQWFATTHWSVIVAAGGDRSEPRVREALEKLCSDYWYPLYGFIRRRGYPTHDAQDLTQGFLVWLLESQHLQTADQQHGKFRSFLLVRLKHFLADARKRDNAQKRGGGRVVVSIDETSAEARLQLEQTNPLSPERMFDREWGFTVLQKVVERLRRRYIECGKGGLFEELHASLSGPHAASTYREIGERLVMSEGAVKVAVHRMRKQFGELLRNEISQTVAEASEIDEEIRHLLRVTSE